MNTRPNQIAAEFSSILDIHLQKLVSGEADDFLEIHQIAEMMHIHPTHLSNTIKNATGKSPCDICNEKTINVAKTLLNQEGISIAEIAIKLTFEPSNFTKYFKRHTQQTPLAFRKQLINS